MESFQRPALCELGWMKNHRLVVTSPFQTQQQLSICSAVDSSYLAKLSPERLQLYTLRSIGHSVEDAILR